MANATETTPQTSLKDALPEPLKKVSRAFGLAAFSADFNGTISPEPWAKFTVIAAARLPTETIAAAAWSLLRALPVETVIDTARAVLGTLGLSVTVTQAAPKPPPTPPPDQSDRVNPREWYERQRIISMGGRDLSLGDVAEQSPVFTDEIRPRARDSAQRDSLEVAPIGEPTPPPLPLFTSYSDDATHWASLAEPDALDAYLAACFRNISDDRKRAFIAYAQKETSND